MSIGMPPPPLRINRTITCLSGLLLCACVVSLAYQGQQFWRLLHPVLMAPTPLTQSPPARIRITEMAELFGASHTPSAPPTTNLHLTLLASFTHPDIAHSSAIIGQPDEPARRIMVGESIANGIVLSGVFAKHVTLTRNNRSENLYFAENSMLGADQ